MYDILQGDAIELRGANREAVRGGAWRAERSGRLKGEPIRQMNSRKSGRGGVSS